MLQFLQPIWLYAMAGIVIPVIIHLWDVRGGKRLKVGSILLIEESARLQGRSLRLTDILLLILRCLLIILLSIVLSKPIFKKQLTVVEEKGWLLMQRKDLHEAYDLNRPTIDSLLKVGYQFHYFNKGFAENDFSNALEIADSLDREQEVDYWTLLKQLNQLVPPDLPIHVFANNSLKRFRGRRPELSMAFTWHGYNLADTVGKSIAMADQMHDDSIRILTASSSNKSLLFNRETVAQSGNGKYRINNNKLNFNAEKVGQELDIDTSRLQVTIFADQLLADANYLKAAIEAIQAFTEYAINVEIVNNATNIKPEPDWLFWLSEKPLPAQATAKRTFLYATGKVQALDSWFRVASYAKVNQEPIVLSRRIQFDKAEDDFHTIWKDGFGSPLLVTEAKNHNLFYFYTRFNPAWTELPWSAQFAEMVFQLIMPPEKISYNFDKRIIGDQQARPVLAKNQKLFDKERFIKKIDLSHYIWLLAFLIFALERFLSLKTNHSRA